MNEEDAWIRIATENATDANTRYDALQIRLDNIRAAFNVLWDTLVPFNEYKQEFFCTVCRYRDPLGPAGSKLHDDNCPALWMARAMDGEQNA